MIGQFGEYASGRWQRYSDMSMKKCQISEGNLVYISEKAGNLPNEEGRAVKIYEGERGLVKLEKKLFDGTEFWYLDAGDNRKLRVWLSDKLLRRDEKGIFIEFPVTGCRIVRTEKGSIVLKPGPANLFWISKHCGYRGRSEIEVLSSAIEILKFYEYDSPRGSLGISQHLFVLTDEPFVKYRWSRTGRLYGRPAEGITIEKLDGTIEELDRIEADEVDEVMKEILEEG
jgi:hypothetical protein